MKTIDSKSFIIHKRNKNIFFDGIDDSFISRVMHRLLRFYFSISKNVNIVYSERIIEYPILFQYLDIQSHRILDFGCVEDLLPVHLASLGYSVTGLDFRPYPFTHKNFNFIQADILSWEPPCEEFDTVISISTIEHVGLSAYGDPVNKDGDKIAVEKLWSSLNVGGKLIITVPAGKPCIERGMKIYNEEKIRKLIPNIETIRFFYKKRRISDWVETTSEVISELVYEDYYALTPAQGVAFIVAKKG